MAWVPACLLRESAASRKPFQCALGAPWPSLGDIADREPRPWYDVGRQLCGTRWPTPKQSRQAP
eukprot:scaffold272974_cov26-Tisochrysis_lutea.AAC.1